MPLTTSDINRLPQLPATAAPTLPMSILAGLNTGVSDPLALIDVRRNRGGGVFDPRYINILDPDHDVVRNGNVVRRRLMVFGPE